MNIEELRKVRNRVPFRPFQLHLTTGEVVAIKHAETMSLPPDERELFVVWTKNGWNLIDTVQVARVSVPKRSGPKRN